MVTNGCLIRREGARREHLDYIYRGLMSQHPHFTATGRQTYICTIDVSGITKNDVSQLRASVRVTNVLKNCFWVKNPEQDRDFRFRRLSYGRARDELKSALELWTLGLCIGRILIPVRDS